MNLQEIKPVLVFVWKKPAYGQHRNTPLSRDPCRTAGAGIPAWSPCGDSLLLGSGPWGWEARASDLLAARAAGGHQWSWIFCFLPCLEEFYCSHCCSFSLPRNPSWTSASLWPCKSNADHLDHLTSGFRRPRLGHTYLTSAGGWPYNHTSYWVTTLSPLPTPCR